MPSLPPFGFDKERFDLSTYVGRTRNFFGMFNPFLLTTTDTQLDEAKDLLQQFREGKVSNTDPETNTRLWDARKKYEAMIHPQTQEKIFPLFRMSGFVPMNVPIACGMLLTSSQSAGLFWQWYNQSYNVAVNYANGNKTNPMPPSKIAQAYGMAVCFSCGLHAGLNLALARSVNLSAGARSVLKSTVPFVAVAGAGALNCTLIRMNEILNGIEVEDADGNTCGISKVAGRNAVFQTAFSRIILPAPILLFPPFAMKLLHSTSFVKARPRIHLPVNLGVMIGFLWMALPCACGLFPQQQSIDVSQLEPSFADKGIQTFYYNRGL